jgi:adenylosuccinate lyase
MSSFDCDALFAISPLDGRYKRYVAPLRECMSEYGLIKSRVRVEVEYLVALCTQLAQLNSDSKPHSASLRALFERNSESGGNVFDSMRSWVSAFSAADAAKVKEIERGTKHDVKAVEYWIKERMDSAGLGEWREWVHFAMTSQDANNVAVPLMLRAGVVDCYTVALRERVLEPLRAMAERWIDVPMLARTHGQPATPTRVGKELMVWVERLDRLGAQLGGCAFAAKFGGATGCLNAHVAAFPDIDWLRFADAFVVDALGLSAREQHTTQVSHYDSVATLFDTVRRINTVLLDASRDLWQYVSLDYFEQRVDPNATGSSTMPHKVNPIDFENAEGNLGIANALLGHIADKLPVSRLQRDLSDSTVLRNLGVPLAHSLMACVSFGTGLGKLLLNRDAIAADLERNWVVVAEAIQTILRREGVEQPYELLKKNTRSVGRGLWNRDAMIAFVNSLDSIDDRVRAELLALSPHTYIGVVSSASRQQAKASSS